MRRIGIGYRFELDAWLQQQPPEIECLEITAEHFFDSDGQKLKSLAAMYPLFVHGLGLSLGTPGPLCQHTLSAFERVAKLADAQWISEHVSFTRTAEVDLGHLNPVALTAGALDVLVDHAIEVAQRCGMPLILENVTSSLRIEGEMSETDFLNRLCQRADCGLLVDVTNLFVNAKNHGFDPQAWLRELEPSRIKQLHVVGYNLVDGHYQDHHCVRIQDDLMELVEVVVGYAPVEAITLERDGRFDQMQEIESEIQRLHQLSPKVV